METQNNNSIKGIEITQQDRVNKIKYVIYNIILIVIIFFLWGYIQDYYNQYNTQKTDILSYQQTQENLQNQLTNDTQMSQILSSMSGHNNKILECINDDICDNLDQKISQNISNIRSYYIINQMISNNENIGSDVINNNINNNLLSYSGESLGQIDSLSIKKTITVDKKNNIKKIPIELTISFASNNSMIKFLQNVEKTIHNDNNMLYKITNIYNNFANSDGLKIGLDLYYVDTSIQNTNTGSTTN